MRLGCTHHCVLDSEGVDDGCHLGLLLLGVHELLDVLLELLLHLLDHQVLHGLLLVQELLTLLQLLQLVNMVVLLHSGLELLEHGLEALHLALLDQQHLALFLHFVHERFQSLLARPCDLCLLELGLELLLLVFEELAPFLRELKLLLEVLIVRVEEILDLFVSLREVRCDLLDVPLFVSKALLS